MKTERQQSGSLHWPGSLSAVEVQSRASQQMLFGAGGVEDDFLYCISLWQPWAQWVALRWKPIETRLHNRFAALEGKRIAIHAALKWDKTALDLARQYLSLEQIERTAGFQKLGGNIICTARVEGVRPCYEEDSASALIDCRTVERFGLFLCDVQTFSAVPAKGRQGMWKIPRSLLGMRVEFPKGATCARSGRKDNGALRSGGTAHE